ncbi:hypothetical protein [Nocardioides euryhalodurans]|uniref:Uncharacterized protein n=1 Tax=Nocardioides euryhalodurans TaxID=2518370 RepID=A0A4P7GMK7_9ACTN|nr:hypothetical protein [Nocardioides euryhalodurans]QBR93011.1 hypothetical protein EXE57_12585 [Nocardioides euryhalodurans]
MADHKDHTADETRTGEPVQHERTVTETRGEVVGREREEHGGVKIGSAFFGWLAATGMAVLLSAIVAATGLLASEASGTDSAGEAAAALDLDLDELGVVGIVVALLIWFVSYYSGGYVAGRMARFDGIKQGVAVWGWGLVIAIAVAVVAAVAGTEYVGIDGFPNVTVDGTTTVVVGAVVVALVALVGAMLGGLAGMRFHRQVDRTGLGR